MVKLKAFLSYHILSGSILINKPTILFLFLLMTVLSHNLSFAEGFSSAEGSFPADGSWNHSIGSEKCVQYSGQQAIDWSCSHRERFIPVAKPDTEMAQLALEKAEIRIKAEALVNQGDSYYEMDDYQKAEQAYRQALRLQSTLSSGWIKLALFYSNLNRDKDALQVLQNGLQTIPDDADIFHEMGLIQVRLRLLSEAIFSLARAALLAPENPHYSYVYAIAMNSYQRPDEALDILHKAYHLHPENKEIITALISINQDNNHNMDALKYAEKLLELEPDDVSLQNFVKLLKLDKK